MLSDQRPQPDEGFHSQPASETNSQPGDDDYGMAETEDNAQDEVERLKAQIFKLPVDTRLRKSHASRSLPSQGKHLTDTQN